MSKDKEIYLYNKQGDPLFGGFYTSIGECLEDAVRLDTPLKGLYLNVKISGNKKAPFKSVGP